MCAVRDCFAQQSSQEESVMNLSVRLRSTLLPTHFVPGFGHDAQNVGAPSAPPDLQSIPSPDPAQITCPAQITSPAQIT
ncbi:unnamed protein product [Boreogadus saida]